MGGWTEPALASPTATTASWAEADRMKVLAIIDEDLTNQQGVVGNEVKVNVLNQPYGRFPWPWIPQYANTNWYNSHNFYGELKDIEAAKLEEVQKFFKTYHAPNNAALALTLNRKRPRFGSRSISGPSRNQRFPPRPISQSPARKKRSRRREKMPWQTGRLLPLPITCRHVIRPSTTRWGCSTRCSRRATTACSTRI